MGTRQHKTKGWVIFAVFCAVLFCVAALRACAAKAAPEGCSLKRVRPAQTACFPLGTTAWRVSDAYGWRTDPITGEEAFHRGTDLACSEGTLVLAAMDGVVTAARRSATYGNYLGPERWCRRVSRWGQRGRRAAPPGRTFTLSFWNRASAMMRGLCWACHEAARPAGAAGVP